MNFKIAQLLSKVGYTKPTTYIYRDGRRELSDDYDGYKKDIHPAPSDDEVLEWLRSKGIEVVVMSFGLFGKIYSMADGSTVEPDGTWSYFIWTDKLVDKPDFPSYQEAMDAGLEKALTNEATKIT